MTGQVLMVTNGEHEAAPAVSSGHTSCPAGPAVTQGVQSVAGRVM
jgi:hypothetical protein